MKLLKESYGEFTVGQLKRILNDVLDQLEGVDNSAFVNTVGNTYFVNSRYFLGIASVGYVDFDNIIDEEATSDDFVEKFAAWYDKADSSRTKEIDVVLNEYSGEDGSDDLIELLADAPDALLDKLADLSGLSR